jgi:hypothetical protein
MAEIDRDIAAYEGMREDLERRNFSKWVVIYDGTLRAVHDSFQQAAEDAVGQFGRGPYLIRQVGAPPVTLPASVMYHPIYADGTVWVP